jgi:hypothetical protein
VAAAGDLVVAARRSAQRHGLPRFARQCAATEALLSPPR